MWGNRVSPRPRPREGGGRRGARAGGWRNPVSPFPARGRGWGEGVARTQGEGETGFSPPPTRWEGLGGGSDPHAGGVGKPGFPTPPPAGGCGPARRARRGMGKPGFPILYPVGGVEVSVHTWGNPRAWERGRDARVASPRASCPRSQENCEHLRVERVRPVSPNPCETIASIRCYAPTQRPGRLDRRPAPSRNP